MPTTWWTASRKGSQNLVLVIQRKVMKAKMTTMSTTMTTMTTKKTMSTAMTQVSTNQLVDRSPSALHRFSATTSSTSATASASSDVLYPTSKDKFDATPTDTSDSTPVDHRQTTKLENADAASFDFADETRHEEMETQNAPQRKKETILITGNGFKILGSDTFYSRADDSMTRSVRPSVRPSVRYSKLSRLAFISSFYVILSHFKSFQEFYSFGLLVF